MEYSRAASLHQHSSQSSSMMLKQAMDDLDDEEFVYVRYRLDGSRFNLRRLQAHSKTHEKLIRDLLFTDYAALVAHTERALQHVTTCFEDSAQLFGLEVSLKKNTSFTPTYATQGVPSTEHHYW